MASTKAALDLRDGALYLVAGEPSPKVHVQVEEQLVWPELHGERLTDAGDGAVGTRELGDGAQALRIGASPEIRIKGLNSLMLTLAELTNGESERGAPSNSSATPSTTKVEVGSFIGSG